MRRRWLYLTVWSVLLSGALTLPLWWEADAGAQAPQAGWGAEEGQACIQCDMYDVAKMFYLSFIPEVKQVAGEPLATQLLEKYVFSQPGHRRLKEGMTKEQLQKIQEFYRERYGEQK